MTGHMAPCPTASGCLVQASLLRLLVPPPPGSTAETLQNYLKLLAEVVKRTTSLAEGLQEIAGSALNVMELAETAFQDALAGHLPLELQWLELLFAARPQTVRGWGGIYLQTVRGQGGACCAACQGSVQHLLRHHAGGDRVPCFAPPPGAAVAAVPGCCTVADGEVVGRCLLSHEVCLGCQYGTPWW